PSAPAALSDYSVQGRGFRSAACLPLRPSLDVLNPFDCAGGLVVDPDKFSRDDSAGTIPGAAFSMRRMPAVTFRRMHEPPTSLRCGDAVHVSRSRILFVGICATPPRRSSARMR